MESKEMEPVVRMSKDIAYAAKMLSDTEARYLVDAYYIIQEDRKRAVAQQKALQENKEPNMVIAWLAEQSKTLEEQIKRALDKYTQEHVMGSWMRQVYGIGPVLSAGLLAYIDITKAPTAGHIWSYAGICANQKWEKGKKRPWNAQLKVLVWKIGQSFLKFSGAPECFYGHLYLKRKQYEVERNDRGDNKQLAAQILTEKKFSKDTEAYKSLSIGKLPAAQLDARARRWAVKIFLSHLQMEWYRRHYGVEPPKPYPIAILGHAHEIKAPV